MRTTLTFFLLVFSISFYTKAQIFYVEPTAKGYEKKISEKLRYDGFKVLESKDGSDFTITCLIRQTSKFNSMYKGYIRVENSRSGVEVAKSDEVRRGAVAVNGFNAGANIFQVIAEKQLPEIVQKLKVE